MKLKSLFNAQYYIVGTVEGDDCPAEEFCLTEDAYEASRVGLLNFLERASQQGFDASLGRVAHLVNRENGIYEFVKGRLRLFFFHGKGKQIVVCTTGVIKKTQKVDKQPIEKAIKLRDEYFNKSGGVFEIIVFNQKTGQNDIREERLWE